MSPSLLQVICVPAAFVASLAFAAEPTPESRFAEAVALTEVGRYEDAVPILEELAKSHPTDNVYWNLGLSAAAIRAHDKALVAWQAYREFAPDDWRGRAKLIQTYQAVGNLEMRDSERSQLMELWKSGTDDSLSNESLYCREQFQVDSRKVMAFEYFNPVGERMVIYSFVVVSGSDSENVKVSLGSYESTNLIAWETGSIPRDKRVYHLDLYASNRHETHGFYESLPSYDETRTLVLRVLSKSSKPLSSSTSGR